MGLYVFTCRRQNRLCNQLMGACALVVRPVSHSLVGLPYP